MECSFNLLGIKKDEIKLRKITDIGIPIESTDDYLYDSDYFAKQIIDYEQLANKQGSAAYKNHQNKL